MSLRIEALVDAFERGRISRRQLVARLGAAVAAAAGARRLLAQDEPESTFEATGIDHVALAVTDVNRSRDFYLKHLGLSVMRQSGDDSCFLRCGKDFLALFRHEKPGLHHYCYAIRKYSPAEAVKRAEAGGLDPRRHGNRVYFDDPDGLTVQVAAGGG
jgi:catechol 2,3-dioxygenase-like lactoylglutathione lyase family enzyme